MEDFAGYIEQHTPLPWTVVTAYPDPWLVGNCTIAVNYVRYGLIVNAVRQYFRDHSVVVDVGVYPGVVPQVFDEFYPKNRKYTYFGCGLGFDAQFREKMESFGVELLECDLDPRLNLSKGRRTTIPLDEETSDLCLFTDAIEHFFDPFYPLKEINRILKVGGILILTTDNITRYACSLALLRDKSCNVPLIESSLFFEGDWRPHFREYSRDELFHLLEWAGFEVLSHKFFEAEFGSWRLTDGNLVKMSRKKTLMGRTKRLIIGTLKKHIPHLRDSHMLVARKKLAYGQMLRSAPRIVDNKKDWFDLRERFSSHGLK